MRDRPKLHFAQTIRRLLDPHSDLTSSGLPLLYSGARWDVKGKRR